MSCSIALGSSDLALFSGSRRRLLTIPTWLKIRNQAAIADQQINEARIAELEDKLARLEVIDVSKLSSNTIRFGATATLIDEDKLEARGNRYPYEINSRWTIDGTSRK